MLFSLSGFVCPNLLHLCGSGTIYLHRVKGVGVEGHSWAGAVRDRCDSAQGQGEVVEKYQ